MKECLLYRQNLEILRTLPKNSIFFTKKYFCDNLIDVFEIKILSSAMKLIEALRKQNLSCSPGAEAYSTEISTLLLYAENSGAYIL
jgi:hypothetical protein